MAQLSSNWKRLQAKLKSDSEGSKPSLKRKQDQQPQPAPKKLKTTSISTAAKAVPKRTASAGSSRQMGGVHSTKIESQPGHGTSPSLALWAEDHDISAEALAEAYDLGLKDNSMMLPSEKDRINHGLSEGVDIGKYVAIDCEMVGVGQGGYESVLARVSIVDFHGRQVYDSYVKPKEKVTDWRTAVSGISRKEMRFARDFEDVQQQVADIFEGRVLIGHDIKHDLEAMKLSHPARDIRDTSKHLAFKKYANGRKPALRILAQQLLNVEIQSGAHSSIEDARVTMLLFRKNKPAFDVDNANKYGQKPATAAGSNGTRKAKKKRK